MKLNQALLSIFQKYLAVNQSLAGINSAELGASMAEKFGKTIGPVNRQLCTRKPSIFSSIVSDSIFSASLSSLSKLEIDAAKILSSQIAIKGYFAGEAAGIRLANRES